ncbi:MAG: TasA family protein [Clostridia bacterium]|nr:TasA family protein [Clostridia bacterium]
MKKKITVAVLVLALVLCFAIGGTLAWLKTETTPVVNTFTYGDINIGLSESDDLDLKMIPGNSIKKDPVVTVKEGSEACWLFVEVKESENFDSFMTYAIAEGWTLYNTTTSGSNIQTDNTTADTYVIYREVAKTTKDELFYVLAGKEGYQNGYVTVNDTVTKKMFAALTEATRPTLTFTAYAVQSDNVVDKNNNGTAADEAWGIIAQGN